MPTLAGETVLLLKATALASTVAVVDLLGAANIVRAQTLPGLRAAALRRRSAISSPRSRSSVCFARPWSGGIGAKSYRTAESSFRPACQRSDMQDRPASILPISAVGSPDGIALASQQRRGPREVGDQRNRLIDAQRIGCRLFASGVSRTRIPSKTPDTASRPVDKHGRPRRASEQSDLKCSTPGGVVDDDAVAAALRSKSDQRLGARPVGAGGQADHHRLGVTSTSPPSAKPGAGRSKTSRRSGGAAPARSRPPRRSGPRHPASARWRPRGRPARDLRRRPDRESSERPRRSTATPAASSAAT